jgi:hypothetical protein
LNSNEKERIGCNGGICKALGTDCNIFLLASNTNAFTCLSPIARNQVPGKHFIQFEEQLTIQQMNQVANQLANQPNKLIWMQSFQETFHQNEQSTVYLQCRMQSFQVR